MPALPALNGRKVVMVFECTLRSLIRAAGITVEEFTKAVK